MPIRPALLISVFVVTTLGAHRADATPVDAALFTKLRTLAAEQLAAGRPVAAADLLLIAAYDKVSTAADPAWQTTVAATTRAAVRAITVPIAFTWDPVDDAFFRPALEDARKRMEEWTFGRIVAPEDAVVVVHWSRDGKKLVSERDDGTVGFRWNLPNRTFYPMRATVRVQLHTQKVKAALRIVGGTTDELNGKAIAAVAEVEHPTPSRQLAAVEPTYGDAGLEAHSIQFPPGTWVDEHLMPHLMSDRFIDAANIAVGHLNRALEERMKSEKDPLVRYDLAMQSALRSGKTFSLDGPRASLYQHLGLPATPLLGDGSGNMDALKGWLRTASYSVQQAVPGDDAAQAEAQGEPYAAWIARYVHAQHPGGDAKRKQALDAEVARVAALLPAHQPVGFDVQITPSADPLWKVFVNRLLQRVRKSVGIAPDKKSELQFSVLFGERAVRERSARDVEELIAHDRGTAANPAYEKRLAEWKTHHAELARVKHVALVTGCALDARFAKATEADYCRALRHRHDEVNAAVVLSTTLGFKKTAAPVKAQKHHVAASLKVTFTDAGAKETLAEEMNEDFATWAARPELEIKARTLDFSDKAITEELAMRLADRVAARIRRRAAERVTLPTDRTSLAFLGALVKRAMLLQTVDGWRPVADHVSGRWRQRLDVAQLMASLGKEP